MTRPREPRLPFKLALAGLLVAAPAWEGDFFAESARKSGDRYEPHEEA